MSKFILALLLFTITTCAFCQNTTTLPVLYGKINETTLRAKPYNAWFDTTYNNYQPNEKVVASLKNQDLKDVKITIFFGSWCGDSKRELPRLMKILHQTSFKMSDVTFIAVGEDSLYKQSPQHEEKDLAIFRLPTIIIYHKGVEEGRIIESPSYSLEKDLNTILSGKPYVQNIKSLYLIQEWLKDGTLLDKNVNLSGLAAQIKPLVSNEYELNGVGYVLKESNQPKEALKVFQINRVLYPESGNTNASLGEGYLTNGDFIKATYYLEKSLVYNKDPKAIKNIVNLLYRSYEIK